MKTIFNKIGSRLWLLAVSIFALLSVTGCIEEDMPFIVLDNDVVTVDTGTSKTSVDVKANVKWGATSDQAWCKIYSTEGNYKGKFDFVVDPNPTTEERTAIITVAAIDGSVQATLMVKQAPIGAKLYISEDKVSFNRNKGSRNIAVVSNHSWKVISSSDWCTVSPESGDKNGNLEIKVPANDTGKERTACVTVVCEVDGDPFIKTIDVVQAATDFFFVVPVMEYNLSNAAKAVEIGYDVEGDDIDIRYETNVDWITFGAFDASAEKVIANVAANTTGKARSAKVVLTASNNGGEPIVRIVEINQSATDFFFVVPVKEFEVTNAGKTIEIPYETEGDNVEINCETNADWISFNELVPGSGKVEAVVAPNTTGKPRTGKIVLSASNNGQEPILQTVTVSQSAKDFYFVVPVQKFELTNAKETVAIKYDVAGDDVKIKHETNVKWISFKEMVEGAGQVEIVVAENKTGADRSAKVVLTASNNAGEPIVHTVEIFQSGKDFYFTVPVKEFDVTNAGGVVAVDYKAEGDDVKIEYRSNAEWLSFKDFVEGANQIEVVVAENATGKEREGQVVISASNNGGEPIEYTVNIKQSAKDFYFVVPVKKYELSNAEKALAFKYEVEGDDVKIKYEANVEWISFKDFVEGAGQIEAVVAANATGEERCAEVVITASNNGGEPIVEKIQIFQGAKDFFFAVPVKEYKFNNDKAELVMPYEVEGDDVKIKYETNVDWITFKEFVEGAGQVEAVVAANKTGESRSAKVVISASNNGGEPIFETVEVFQGAKDFYFVVPVKKYNLSNAEKALAFKYEVGGDDVKIKYEANVDWITFKDFVEGAGQIEAVVAANATGVERSAEVMITASNNGGEPIVEKIQISQGARDFYFVVPVKKYELSNAEKALAFKYEVAGDDVKIKYEANVDWITFKEFVEGTGQIEAVVAANATGEERSAEIVISASNNGGEPIVEKILVFQGAKDFFFAVPVKEYKFTNVEAELVMPYEVEGDNVKIKYETNADWITFKDFVEGAGQIEAVIAANKTGKDRSAKVVISASNNGGEPIVETVEVFQGAKDFFFVIPVTDYNIGFAAKRFPINYKVNGDSVKVEYETNVDWIDFGEFIPDSCRVNVEVYKNKTGKERTGKVIVTASNNGGEPIVRTVTVTQAASGFYFVVPVEEYNLNNEKHEIDIEFDIDGENLNVIPSTDVNWIEIGELSYRNNTLHITVTANKTGKPRTGKVVIRATSNSGEPIIRTIVINQSAKDFFFAVPIKKYNVSEASNAIIPIIYNTDGDNVKVNAQPNVSWIQVVHEDTHNVPDDYLGLLAGDGSVIVRVLPNLTGKERTGTVTLTATNNNGEPVVEVVEIVQGKQDAHLELTKDKFFFGLEGGEDMIGGIVQLGDIDLSQGPNSALPTVVTVDTDADWIEFPNGQNHIEEMSRGESVLPLAVPFEVKKNTTGKERVAEIQVTCFLAGQEAIIRKVVVEQTCQEFFFVVPVKEYTVGNKETVIPVKYRTAGDIVSIDHVTGADWISFDPVSARNQIDVRVEANTTGKERSAEIAITASNNMGKPVVETIRIIQSATEYYFVVPVKEYNVAKAKTVIPVNYYANTEILPVELNTNAGNWVHFNNKPDERQVEITVDANTTGQERTAIVVLTAANNGNPVSETIEIHQAATEFYFTVPVKDYSVGNKESVIPIKYRTAGDIVSIDHVTGADWISFDPVSARNQIDVRVEANTTGKERSAEIAITASNNMGKPVVETIKITQSSTEYFFEVPVREYNVAKARTVIPVKYYANSEILPVEAATNAGNWIHFTNKPAENTIDITVDANTTGQDRTATVVLTAANNGNPVSETIQIHQAASEFYFTIPVKDYTVGNKESVIPVKYKTAGDIVSVDQATSVDWISFDPVSARNQIAVRVKPNTTGKVRSAEIAITASNNMGKPVVETIKITQTAEDWYFVLGNDFFQVPSRSDANISFNILYHRSDNVTKITPVSNTNWIQVSEVAPQDLEGNRIRVSCKPNLTKVQREGEIAITVELPGYAPKVYKVRVLQSATERVLDILSDEVEFEGNKGLKAIVEYVTNCKVDGGFSAGTGAADISFQDYCPWLAYDNKIDLSRVELETQSDNITGKDRFTYFTIKTKGFLDSNADGSWVETSIVRKVKVTQHSLETKFEFGKDNYVFGFNGGKNYVTLLSTGDWKIDTEVALPSWIKFDPVQGTGNANITIDLKENVFAQKRSAQILFINTTLNKKAVLNIEQEGNPAGVVNFSHLGKGYDVSGMYAYDKDVRASVLDCAKMYEAGQIADIKNPNHTEEENIHGETREEYVKAYTTSAGVSASVAGFTAGVETNFSRSALSSMEHSFGTFRHMTKKQIIMLHSNLKAADLMNSRSDAFVEDCRTLTVNDLISKYGTHVIMGLSLGGVLEYSMAADVTNLATSVDFGLAVEAGFEMAGYGGGASTGVSHLDSVRNESSGFESKLICRGGESQFASNGVGNDQSTYDQWLNSLQDKNKWVMVDYEGSSLIPLWEFIDEEEINRPGLKSELEKAVKGLLTGTDIEQVSYIRELKPFLASAVTTLDDEGDKNNTQWQWNITSTVDNKHTRRISYANGSQNNPNIELVWNGKDKGKDGRGIRDFGENEQCVEVPYKLSIREGHTLEINITNILEKDPTGDNEEFEDGYVKLTYFPATDIWKDESSGKTYKSEDKIEIHCQQKNSKKNKYDIKLFVSFKWE